MQSIPKRLQAVIDVGGRQITKVDYDQSCKLYNFQSFSMKFYVININSIYLHFCFYTLYVYIISCKHTFVSKDSGYKVIYKDWLHWQLPVMPRLNMLLSYYIIIATWHDEVIQFIMLCIIKGFLLQSGTHVQMYIIYICMHHIIELYIIYVVHACMQ